MTSNNLQGMRISHTMVRDLAVEKLRSAIIAGDLLPGQRLIEKDLCAQIGVSRTSVREALRMLEGEKLVHADSHKGPRVATLSAEEAGQVYEVRSLLEPVAGSRAAIHATPEQIGRLNSAVEEFGVAVSRDDRMALVRLAREFYDTLLEASQNQVMAEVLRSLNARISYLRATSMSAPGRAPHSFQEMLAISKAIARKDPEAAAAACAKHVDMAARAGIARLAEQARSSPMAKA